MIIILLLMFVLLLVDIGLTAFIGRETNRQIDDLHVIVDGSEKYVLDRIKKVETKMRDLT